MYNLVASSHTVYYYRPLYHSIKHSLQCTINHDIISQCGKHCQVKRAPEQPPLGIWKVREGEKEDTSYIISEAYRSNSACALTLSLFSLFAPLCSGFKSLGTRNRASTWKQFYPFSTSHSCAVPRGPLGTKWTSVKTISIEGCWKNLFTKINSPHSTCWLENCKTFPSVSLPCTFHTIHYEQTLWLFQLFSQTTLLVKDMSKVYSQSSTASVFCIYCLKFVTERKNLLVNIDILLETFDRTFF